MHSSYLSFLGLLESFQRMMQKGQTTKHQTFRMQQRPLLITAMTPKWHSKIMMNLVTKWMGIFFLILLWVIYLMTFFHPLIKYCWTYSPNIFNWFWVSLSFERLCELFVQAPNANKDGFVRSELHWITEMKHQMLLSMCWCLSLMLPHVGLPLIKWCVCLLLNTPLVANINKCIGQAIDFHEVIDNYVSRICELCHLKLSTTDWTAIELVMGWLKTFRSATTQILTTKISMMSSVKPGLGYNNLANTRVVLHSYNHSYVTLLLQWGGITFSHEDREVKSGMYKLSSKLRVSRYKSTVTYILWSRSLNTWQMSVRCTHISKQSIES